MNIIERRQENLLCKCLRVQFDRNDKLSQTSNNKTMYPKCCPFRISWVGL